jgi:hypothetical protein
MLVLWSALKVTMKLSFTTSICCRATAMGDVAASMWRRKGRANGRRKLGRLRQPWVKPAAELLPRRRVGAAAAAAAAAASPRGPCSNAPPVFLDPVPSLFFLAEELDISGIEGSGHGTPARKKDFCATARTPAHRIHAPSTRGRTALL